MYETPLQGPFTRDHVGGMQHRHTDTVGMITDNIAVVSARENVRPEAWRIRFGNLGAAATATITFSDTDAGSLDYNQTITIISTDGTSKTYTTKASNNYGSNEFDADGGFDDKAEALKGAIEHSSGHAGKITVSRTDNVLTLTQAVVGTAGNTTITEGITDCAAVSFTGATDKEVSKMYGPGAQGPHYPRSWIYRDGLVKRPVNISNIQSTQSSAHRFKYGNYHRKEEVVQTAGRNINNLWLIHHSGVISTTEPASYAVSGDYDFELEDRTYLRSIRKNGFDGSGYDFKEKPRTVIAEKFSAPGGPEVNLSLIHI
mgnify:CR=1 FL=1